eukprot:2053690-Pleurochrysis_carterae.AAC.1
MRSSKQCARTAERRRVRRSNAERMHRARASKEKKTQRKLKAQPRPTRARTTFDVTLRFLAW